MMAREFQTNRTAEATDPRVLRSRELFLRALDALLKRKRFEEISIQDIAEESTLNRATFYLHYADKTALLQALTESQFKQLVAKRGLSFDNCDGALHAIALGVCDYLAASSASKGQLGMAVEVSIIAVIEGIFRNGSANHGRPVRNSEFVGTTAAWAIYGAARRWLQSPKRMPAEKMATLIESLVKPIFTGGSREARKAYR